MTELSSNWKKLQERIKTEKAEKSAPPAPKKRKAEAQPPSQPRKAKTARTASTASAGQRLTRKMGGVQSSLAVEGAQRNVPLPLALWTGDTKPMAEDLAEAYDVSIRATSTVPAESAKDRVNHGLSAEIVVGKYIALDCEMVGVGPGGRESALARVSMVDFHGQQVYDSYVRPQERVTDWRTAVSGISPREMRLARDFELVQRQVRDVLHGRILVGHDIKHDLEALRSSHPARDVRDTARHPAFRKHGNGGKPGLKVLARDLLGLEIQQGAHSSTEDARVTMLLFRKHKPGFDVDHANRYAPPGRKGKTKK